MVYKNNVKITKIRPDTMQVVGDVVLTESQSCRSLVSVVKCQVKPAVSPGAANLKFQELRDVEQQTDPEGG